MASMELVCEKYKEVMQEDAACCRHPKEYCKFRSACMIQFVSMENGGCREGNKEEGAAGTAAPLPEQER